MRDVLALRLATTARSADRLEAVRRSVIGLPIYPARFRTFGPIFTFSPKYSVVRNAVAISSGEETYVDGVTKPTVSPFFRTFGFMIFGAPITAGTQGAVIAVRKARRRI